MVRSFMQRKVEEFRKNDILFHELKLDQEVVYDHDIKLAGNLHLY